MSLRSIVDFGRRAAMILPGLAVCLLIATIGTMIGQAVPLVGAAVASLVLGLLISLVRHPSPLFVPGVKLSSKIVLQCSVALLGAQLSFAQIGAVGAESLPIMLITLTACLVAAWLLGRWLGIEQDLTTMIGVGTAICGASAIAAVAPVIKARSEDISYAISTIFAFNVAAVLTFPTLGRLLNMSETTFGLFAGTVVNDTSSVVAAASIFGGAALSYAVVVKLVRTLAIIPITLTLAARRSRTETQGKPLIVRALTLIPWFLIVFLILALLNSTGVIPVDLLPDLRTISVFLIAVAMAGIGLSTDVQSLRKAGFRPLLLGGSLWIIVAVTAVASIYLFNL